MRNRIPRVRVKINAPECENSHYSLIKVYPHAFIIEGLCCTITAIGKHRKRGAYFFPANLSKTTKMKMNTHTAKEMRGTTFSFAVPRYHFFFKPYI